MSELLGSFLPYISQFMNIFLSSFLYFQQSSLLLLLLLLTTTTTTTTIIIRSILTISCYAQKATAGTNSENPSIVT